MAKEDIRVIVSEEYIKALQLCEPIVQVAANSFLKKVLENPWNPSLNIEKLNLPDTTLRSARVNRDVRVILSAVENGGTFCLLYIDHHQEAYRWAERKRIQLNEKIGRIDIFEVMTQSQDYESYKQKLLLFSSYSDSKLTQLGLSEIEIFTARTIIDKDDLESKQKYFSKSMYEMLYFLANGDSFEDVLEVAASCESRIASNNIALLNGFFVIDDNESVEEYKQILEGQIEKWRVFLHPSQNKLVQSDYAGPAKILGEAGTGKTVVALHRAKRLAQTADARVLFTTYTSNLAADIEKNLSLICDSKTKDKIDVVNIDSWVLQYLSQSGERTHVIYQSDVKAIWEQAIAKVEQSMILPIEFYQDEWERIVIDRNITSEDQYKTASRTGRSFPLNRKKREIAWHVIEVYRKCLAEKNCIDLHLAIQRTLELLDSGILTPKYTNILVDESQDFSSNMMKLIRAIAGPEHTNDIFLVGDARQNIYGKSLVLKNCGINTAGRSSVLKINYRTTDEIRRWALRIIQTGEILDLDGERIQESSCLSLLHGKRPIVLSFTNSDDENKCIERTIRNWLNSGYHPKSICIAARTKKQINVVKLYLQNSGIITYEIKGGMDDSTFEEIRVGTMHRIKGMEYDCLILCGINDGVMPLSSIYSILDSTKQKELEMQDRSLLYVAATRAKKELVVTCSGKISRFIDLV